MVGISRNSKVEEFRFSNARNSWVNQSKGKSWKSYGKLNLTIFLKQKMSFSICLFLGLYECTIPVESFNVLSMYIQNTYEMVGLLPTTPVALKIISNSKDSISVSERFELLCCCSIGKVILPECLDSLDPQVLSHNFGLSLDFRERLRESCSSVCFDAWKERPLRTNPPSESHQFLSCLLRSECVLLIQDQAN